MQPITDSTALAEELHRQLALLEFGIVEVTPRQEFVAILEQSLKTGIPLRVKCGIDPTRTDVHLGHLVPYCKMRSFQDLGHTGVVIIGDYTAQIGDPTGKDESRKPLTEEQVAKNSEFYQRQLLKILDPEKTEFRYQSEWFRPVGLGQVLSWAGQTTLAKLLSHETFGKRFQTGASLGLHELFYPVLQGIDSVEIKADVELGGSDQKFNVLMGRDYQKHAGQRPQCAMLLPLVTGLDGQQKMSSSLDNYIGVDDEPFDMFGKVMSAPDHLMPEYFKHLAHLPPEECARRERELTEGGLHPNNAKKQLATEVVALFYDQEAAKQQCQQFERVFAQKQVPDEIPEYRYGPPGESLIKVMVGSGLVPSNSEARRMLQQGGVSIVQGDKLQDAQQILDKNFNGRVLKVGKRRFLRMLWAIDNSNSPKK